MSARTEASGLLASVSQAIRQEIHRFESVHPVIYNLYDLIENIPNPRLRNEVREHVISIEDDQEDQGTESSCNEVDGTEYGKFDLSEYSFVNSPEWTLSRYVTELRLGVLGSINSGKSALVHRYLTGAYLPEESPEGGRFKKEIIVDGQSYLLLIRDEGGTPELQFTQWADAVLLVFGLDDEDSFAAVNSFYTRLAYYRDMREVPVMLVGTQDAISETSPRAIDDARVRQMAATMRHCPYHETCATYGLNIERVFQDACQKIIHSRSGNIPPAVSLSRQHSSSNVLVSRSPQNPMMRGEVMHVNGDTQTKITNQVAEKPEHFEDVLNNTATTKTTRGPALTAREPRKSTVQQFQHMALSENLQAASKARQLAQSPSVEARSRNSQGSIEPLPVSSSPQWRPVMTSAVPEAVAKKSASLPDHASSRVFQQSNVQTNSPKSNLGLLTPILARKQKNSKNVLKSNSFSGNPVAPRVVVTPMQATVPEAPSPLASPVPMRKTNQSKGVTERYSPAGDDHMDGNLIVPNATPGQVRKQNRRSNFFSRKGDEDKDKKTRNDDNKPGCGRSIPVRQGFLYKKSGKPLSKEWKKKFVALVDDGRLLYFPSLNDYMDNSHSKEIALGRTTVKIPGGRPRGSEVPRTVPPTSSNGQISNADSSTALVAETPLVKKKHRRARSGARHFDGNVPDGDLDGYEFSIVSLDGHQWFFEAATSEERDEWMLAIERQILSSLQLNDSNKSKVRNSATSDVVVAASIRSVFGNQFCADCGSPNPDWASLNLGTVLCIECSGVHRNLGTHLSRVRSLDLDDWPPELVLVMTSVGNGLANTVWEAETKGRTKPASSSSREEKEKWIRSKYELRDFLPPLPYPDIPFSQQLIDAVARQDVYKTILVLSHCDATDRRQVSERFSPTDWRTALHITAFLGSVVILQLLLWYGADAKAIDHEGHDPLYYAQVSHVPSAAACGRLLQAALGSSSDSMGR